MFCYENYIFTFITALLAYFGVFAIMSRVDMYVICGLSVTV